MTVDKGGHGLSLTISYEEHPHVLVTRLEGRFDLADVQIALEQLPSRLEAAGTRTAFVDLTQVDSFPLATQRHKLGIHAAKAWPRWMRVVLVVKAEWMRKMFSNTARTRGVDVHSFGTAAHAWEWIGMEEPGEAPLVVSYQRHTDHLLIRMSGAFTPQRVENTITSLPGMARSSGVSNVIFDCLQLMDLPQTMARHQLGRFVAKTWPRFLRVAVVVPPHEINKMFENAARAGGVQLWVVGSLDEARPVLGL